MGYELKMFVGIVGYEAPVGGEGRHYFEVVSMFDLSKPGSNSSIYALAIRDRVAERLMGEYPKIYLFDLDGNKQYTEDCCGEVLRAIPIDEVITELESDSEKDNYWRFDAGLGMLKAMRDESDRELSVVLYGH